MAVKRGVKPRKILFLADPWANLDHARDSTLHLGAAAEAIGLEPWWAEPDALKIIDGTPRVRVKGRIESLHLNPDEQDFALTEFHSIHWRKDPPVDAATLRTWALLAAFPQIPLISPARALLVWNEKFGPLRFPKWSPDTLVSNQVPDWERFHQTHGQVIAKPSAEAASRGVTLISTNWPKALLTLQQLQAKYGPWILLQKFLPEVQTLGETRVFLLRGKPVATIRKTPAQGEPIMNLDAPESSQPKLEMVKMSAAQKTRAETIGKLLAKDCIHLASVDFIGSHLLEINVTSVGLLAWVDQQVSASQSIAKKYWSSLPKN